MAVNTKNGNTATIGFEQQIWAAADTLCANMNAAKYKQNKMPKDILPEIPPASNWTSTALRMWSTSSLELKSANSVGTFVGGAYYVD